MRTVIAFLSALLSTIPIAAQESVPDPASAGKPHAALVRMAGAWEAHAKFWSWKDATSAPTECTATVNAKMIMGDRFLFQNVDGQCMDQPVEAIGVIGHDNKASRYQAVSFDNMGTSISLHAGEMDDSGDIVLDLSYQDQVTGQTVHRRTVRRLISEREWLESAHETRNGDKRKVMEIRARRIDSPMLNRANDVPTPSGAGSNVASANGADRIAVEAVIETWNEGWRTKNADLAAQGYSLDADWINAFGMRERGRDAIAARLKEVFGLPFVMDAQSRVVKQEIRFTTPTVAVVITQVEREGQKSSTGEQLGTRRTSHQRVLVKAQSAWQIVSHLISDARETTSAHH